MKRALAILAAGAMAAMAVSCNCCTDTVSSPDGKIVVKVSDGGYSLSYEGTLVLDGSIAEMELADGRTYGTATKAKKSLRKGRSEHIESPLYRQKSFDMEYNTLTLTFDEDWSMVWYVCNEGAAYRFIGGHQGDTTIVLNEKADFNFVSDTDCWLAYSSNPKNPYAMAFEGLYTHQMLSDGCDLPAFMPISAGLGDGKRITFLESDLRAYPGMFARLSGTTISAEFAGYPSEFGYYAWRRQAYVTAREDYIAVVDGHQNFPWRVMAITARDCDMPVNNMVYALAEPSRIEDASWVEPGFSAWEWWNDWGLDDVDFKPGINMDTYRHYIDFAAANGLEYMVVDEGWSTPSVGDVLTSIDEIDVPALVEYGRERNVKIVLWVVYNCLDDKLEEACRKYSEMGVAGFKVDFMDRNDQTAVDMIWRIAECAARYHLILDYHGIFAPTGICRTYPNVVNYEGIHGEENMKWIERDIDMPAHNACLPYLRMMCGYADYTPGGLQNVTREKFVPQYDNPLVQGTRAQQVALYVTLDSPFTMLCDTPSRYRREQETTDFICSFPRTYDQTVGIDGKIGEYIVMARRSGENWYIAGTTNWESRNVEIKLDFLDKGAYDMEMFIDGENADNDPCDYAIDKATIDGVQSLCVRMAQGGGFVVKFIRKDN